MCSAGPHPWLGLSAHRPNVHPMPPTQGAVEPAKTCPDAEVKVNQHFVNIINTIIWGIVNKMVIMVAKLAMNTLALRLR